MGSTALDPPHPTAASHRCMCTHLCTCMHAYWPASCRLPSYVQQLEFLLAAVLAQQRGSSFGKTWRRTGGGQSKSRYPRPTHKVNAQVQQNYDLETLPQKEVLSILLPHQMLEEGETHPLALYYIHSSNSVSGLGAQRHNPSEKGESEHRGGGRKEMNKRDGKGRGKHLKEAGCGDSCL